MSSCRYPFGGLGLMGSGGLGSGPGLGTDTATSALNMAGSPCLYYSPAAAASGLLRPDLAVQAAPGASWLGLDLANRAAGAASARRPAGAVAPAHLPGKLEAVQTLRTHHQADDAARAAASMFPAPLVLPETDAGTVEDMQDIHAAPPLVPQDRQIVAEQSHEDPGPRGGCLTACCRLLSGRKRPAGQSLTARASKMSGGHRVCSLCLEQACVWSRTYVLQRVVLRQAATCCAAGSEMQALVRKGMLVLQTEQLSRQQRVVRTEAARRAVSQ